MFQWEKGTMMWAIGQIDQCSIDGKTEIEFFNRFKKKSYNGDIDISRYHIGGREGSYYWDPDVDIYKDARNGLLLRFSGRPIAMTTYGVAKHDGISFVKPDTLNQITDEFLYIVQLQGICLANETLKPLKWERMLVAVIENYAQELGFSSCAIQPASQNTPMGGFNERSKMRYDVTAQRSGYKMENEIWMKHFR